MKGECFVFSTMGFAPRNLRSVVAALKADAFQLGKPRQYVTTIVPNPGHEKAVKLICERIFQKLPPGQAKQFASLPRTPLN